MKSIKKTMAGLIAILIFIMALLLIPNNIIRTSFAKTSYTSDIDGYWNSARSGNALARNSSQVEVNSNPSMIDYPIGIGTTYDTASFSGIKSLTPEQETAMRSNMHADIVRYYDNGCLTLADNSIKGNYKVKYTNVGEYNGENVDLVLTVTDYELMPSNLYGNNVDFAILGFNKQECGVRGIGLGQTSNLAWVEVKYEFFKNGTNTPITVKGYTTYWDVDAMQGVHFVDGLDQLHVTNKSQLYITNINGRPYVYDKLNPNLTGKDSKGSVTEAFNTKTNTSGNQNSFTRVYTFTQPKMSNGQYVDSDTYWRAAGGMGNSAELDGAVKDYREASLYKEGDSVRFGNIIQYRIDMTNGDTDGDAIQNMVITDTISAYGKYVPGSTVFWGTPQPDPTITVKSDGSKELKWTGLEIPSGQARAIVYSV